MNDYLKIKRPTLIVNRIRAQNNIYRMRSKAEKCAVRFRPHFKTHQSSEIGNWYREQGITAITVSSVKMAEYFANNGWKDITIAFPVNIHEIEEINGLAKKLTLNLLVESNEVIDFLSKKLESKVNCWLKIDTGYHRTGIDVFNYSKIRELADNVTSSSKMRFKGLLTHSGHTYFENSVKGIERIYFKTTAVLNKIRNKLYSDGYKNIELSVGDTPSCSIVQNLGDVDEIRPGNFIFYDVMQYIIGSCSENDLAVAVICPVVAKHESRNELVIYGGSVHLSKEYTMDKNRNKIFGYIAQPIEHGWGPILKNSFVSALSQEHGIITVTNEVFDLIKIGDRFAVLPVHSCLVVDLYKEYISLDGEVIEIF